MQLAKSLPLELARNQIRVNAIALDYFMTEMTDFRLENEKTWEYIRDSVPMSRLGELQCCR